MKKAEVKSLKWKRVIPSLVFVVLKVVNLTKKQGLLLQSWNRMMRFMLRLRLFPDSWYVQNPPHCTIYRHKIKTSCTVWTKNYPFPSPTGKDVSSLQNSPPVTCCFEQLEVRFEPIRNWKVSNKLLLCYFISKLVIALFWSRWRCERAWSFNVPMKIKFS